LYTYPALVFCSLGLCNIWQSSSYSAPCPMIVLQPWSRRLQGLLKRACNLPDGFLVFARSIQPRERVVTALQQGISGSFAPPQASHFSSSRLGCKRNIPSQSTVWFMDCPCATQQVNPGWAVRVDPDCVRRVIRRQRRLSSAHQDTGGRD